MQQRFDSLRGLKILVTGHTGFTGSWVSLWLKRIGAEVIGYSLPPETHPSLFVELGLEETIEHHLGDIRDLKTLKGVVLDTQPDLVLHLAAQPLVRKSYRLPIETFEVNVTGTVNVLEAALTSDRLRGVLCITTDKVYKNNDSGRPFKESDELGGDDPYSASKAAAELAISSYRRAFYNTGQTSIPLVAARGGNIIGGGDWSEDRLIPDCIRASQRRQPLLMRSPRATRPWQHVLSLADGYLTILSRMIETPDSLSPVYNLGPNEGQVLQVSEVVSKLSEALPTLEVQQVSSNLKEAAQLQLDSSLARRELGWSSRWDAVEAIQQTAVWYRDQAQGHKALGLCEKQISSWEN